MVRVKGPKWTTSVLEQTDDSYVMADVWLARHKNVHFHFTPTHASWLNQVEIWFSILARNTLEGASFTSVPKLRQAIDAFIDRYNQHAVPYQWRKATARPKSLTSRITNL